MPPRHPRYAELTRRQLLMLARIFDVRIPRTLNRGALTRLRDSVRWAIVLADQRWHEEHAQRMKERRYGT